MKFKPDENLWEQVYPLLDGGLSSYSEADTAALLAAIRPLHPEEIGLEIEDDQHRAWWCQIEELVTSPAWSACWLLVRLADVEAAQADAEQLASGRGPAPDFGARAVGGTHALALVAVGAHALAALPALESRYPDGGWCLARDTDLDAWLAERGLTRYTREDET